MIPSNVSDSIDLLRILHVCGDDPKLCCHLSNKNKYSPRMSRWSSLVLLWCFVYEVFSTYVEMILISITMVFRPWSILHVCGDDPKSCANIPCQKLYSPRMWRWSYIHASKYMQDMVFSTYVEMILILTRWLVVNTCILHVCGDDPNFYFAFNNPKLYSPRMWRWS